jgi:hypothetical protein
MELDLEALEVLPEEEEHLTGCGIISCGLLSCGYVSCGVMSHETIIIQ